MHEGGSGLLGLSMCLGVFFKVADNVFSNFKEHPKQYGQEALTGKAVIAAVCKESMARGQ